MKVFERYFDRNPIGNPLEFDNNPEAVVIIPVLDDRDIFGTLDSLARSTCKNGNVGVVVLVNHAENCPGSVKSDNCSLAGEIERFAGEKLADSRVECRVVRAFDLPPRYAGVGLARKIAMDCAAYFLYTHGKTGCPILSLDADTTVDADYTDEVIDVFRSGSLAGVSIAFAHRPDGSHVEAEEAMIKYELYLRYYRWGLVFAGHPHAYHCIGSAFAVRASDYVAQGGMNRRQAGEDFYFIQKLIATGRFRTLGTTTVYPSARFSDRTPFGTGRALRRIAADGGRFPVYNFEAFRLLRSFLQGVGGLYKLPAGGIDAYIDRQECHLRDFLNGDGAGGKIAVIGDNCASLYQFKKRFFNYFNAFRVLKFLNYIHVSALQKRDISAAVRSLFAAMDFPCGQDDLGNLLFLRERDRSDLSVDYDNGCCHRCR